MKVTCAATDGGIKDLGDLQNFNAVHDYGQVNREVTTLNAHISPFINK